eukprot:superscaffoldBa00002245_g13640
MENCQIQGGFRCRHEGAGVEDLKLWQPAIINHLYCKGDSDVMEAEWQVQKGAGKIAALRHELFVLPAASELEEIRQCFQHLANSPVFLKKGQFLNTFVGYPGSVRDTRVLKNSGLFKEALYPPSGYFIVGDGGYPCTDQPIAIITPYREQVHGKVQSRFSQHHAKAHNIIERAFGIMMVRWRCLLFKALEVNHTFAPVVITACCPLHNICLTAGDILEPTEEVEEIDVPQPHPVRGKRSRHGRRDRLANQLSGPDHNPVELNEHDL